MRPALNNKEGAGVEITLGFESSRLTLESTYPCGLTQACREYSFKASPMSRFSKYALESCCKSSFGRYSSFQFIECNGRQTSRGKCGQHYLSMRCNDTMLSVHPCIAALYSVGIPMMMSVYAALCVRGMIIKGSTRGQCRF